jgi:hypothetical protein
VRSKRSKLRFDAGVPIRFFALDALGKSGAHHHHRRYRSARAGKPAAGFLLAAALSGKTVSNDRTCFVVFSAIYKSGKNATIFVEPIWTIAGH